MDFNTLLNNENKKLKKEIIRECTALVALFFLTVLVIYSGIPKILKQIYILLLLVLFWNSNKNYFWLAFFLILLSQPLHFFIHSSAGYAHRLPLFNLASGVSLSTHDIFMIAALLKAILYGKKYKYKLFEPLIFLAGYAILLFIASVYIYGISFEDLTKFLRRFIFWCYFISIPYLISEPEDIIKSIYLFTPFVYLIFLSGIYFIITGTYFVYFFDPGSVRELSIMGQTYRWHISGAMIIHIGLIFPLILSFHKNYDNYLVTTAIASYIAMMLSATRVWFIVFSLIIISYFLIKGGLSKLIKYSVLATIILLILANLFGGFKNNIAMSWQRLSSVFSIGNEDSFSTRTLEGKIYGEKGVTNALQGIGKKPILGWGFSTEAQKYINEDIGNFSLIVQVGLMGFFIFSYFWIKFFMLMNNSKKNLSPGNPYKKSIIIFSISFFGYLIAHFTTHQFFGYILLGSHIFFLCYFIYLSEYFVEKAKDYENKYLDLQ